MNVLNGSELLSVNQGTSTVRTTVSAIDTFIAFAATGQLGESINLVANLATAGSSLAFTADQITLGTSLTSATVILSAFSKTNNLAASGAGGLDTGTATSPGYVGVYAIYNPTTQVASTLATSATAAALPEIYGGANMPAGYTYSRLLSVRQLSANNTYQVGYQQDRKICVPETIFQRASVTDWLSTDISTAVPKNAKTFSGRLVLVNAQTESALAYFSLAPAASTMGRMMAWRSIAGIITYSVNSINNMPILTAQTIYYKIEGTGAFMLGSAFTVTAYSF